MAGEDEAPEGEEEEGQASGAGWRACLPALSLLWLVCCPVLHVSLEAQFLDSGSGIPPLPSLNLEPLNLRLKGGPPQAQPKGTNVKKKVTSRIGR